MKKLSQEKYRDAAKILQKGGLVAFPTETVFGFGVVYDNEKAYRRLIDVKRRPPEQPFTLMCADKTDIDEFAFVDERARKLINAFFPGQFTIILKAKDTLPSWVISKEGNVGIRVPDYYLVQNLIRAVGKPLLVPSANRHGEPPLTKSVDVYEVFKNEVDAVLEGASISNIPSTIVIIDKDVKIIREGYITKKDIDKVLEGKKMKIVLGSDHAGLEYKLAIKKHLEEKGHTCEDVGTHTKDSCDYPIFGRAAAEKVAKKEADFGILVCSSGEGISIAANKVKGVRCGLAYNDDVARLIRQHNDANMIAFGQSFMELKDVIRRVDIFLSTAHEGGRHARRVSEIE